MSRQILFSAFIGTTLCVSNASACPLCKTATEDSLATAQEQQSAQLQPRAYAASIAFMLFVPSAIFTTLGYGLYKMHQAEKKLLATHSLQDDHSSEEHA